MTRKLPNDVKCTSVLRRIPALDGAGYVPARGYEGNVCAFALAQDARPIVLESASGRSMTVAPRDVFLGTPGHRESTRWVVGGIPDGGLVPGKRYWVLADNGVVGELFGDSPLEKSYVERVSYLGAICGTDGKVLNIRSFAETAARSAQDHGAPVFLIVGTSAEVGKTTAGIAILRRLRRAGLTRIVALKATGTSSLAEIALYRDFGASRAFDCVDSGLPTTYPSRRPRMSSFFERGLDTCLSLPASAVLIECGGDILGANVPVFLRSLKRRRPQAKVILAAADSLGALGATQMLRRWGFVVSLITGPCTDTPTLQQRARAMCRTPAVNMARGDDFDNALKLDSSRLAKWRERER
jgi:Domain of unknown function (DUF1611_C) P-loop domain